MRMNEEHLTVIFIFGLFIAFMVWFYLPKWEFCGKVSNKWVESSTSCSGDSCSNSRNYLIQFENGEIYSTLFGSRVFDKTMVGNEYCYTMRGRRWHLFGWRITTPTIFNFN